jgi:THO complex subunit 4
MVRGDRGNGRRPTGTSIRGQPIKRGFRAPPRGRGIGGRNPSNIETTGKVVVSNLGSHVTSDDVKEIFEKIGTITHAFVTFDKSGKSTGTAEVVYARKDDARRAQRDLDGAQVDGTPINVTLSSQSLTFIRARGQFSNRMDNNNGSRGRGFGRGNNNYSNYNSRHPLDRRNN